MQTNILSIKVHKSLTFELLISQDMDILEKEKMSKVFLSHGRLTSIKANKVR